LGNNMKVSILGSTGSIGTQTLQVADKLRLTVAAVTGNRNVSLLEEQIRHYKPELAAVCDEASAEDLKARVADTPVRVVSGEEGLSEAACLEDVDTVVTAVVGTVGLRPTMAAIHEGKRIALANKETLVCAGEVVMTEAEYHGADIIPVDSEHSAIFQCAGRDMYDPIKRIWLTASGGPFRGMSFDELEAVTPEMALRHPSWSMGAKVTVDSATMMNKGLEIIEAMHLFSVSPEDITVLVHPQSIVHSMVQFEDNSVIAQMGIADMRLPIQYALTYPVRLESLCGEVDFTQLGALTFEAPNSAAFPCLGLARRAAEEGGTACAVMNAANEEAVAKFLKGKIGFNDIYRAVLGAMDAIAPAEADSIDVILDADLEARKFVKLNY